MRVLSRVLTLVLERSVESATCSCVEFGGMAGGWTVGMKKLCLVRCRDSCAVVCVLLIMSGRTGAADLLSSRFCVLVLVWKRCISCVSRLCCYGLTCVMCIVVSAV